MREDGIRICREVVSHLNWKKLGPEPDNGFRNLYMKRRTCLALSQKICVRLLILEK